MCIYIHTNTQNVHVEVLSIDMRFNAKFCTAREENRPMSEFSHLEAFIVQILFFDLKLLIKYSWLQPVTGRARGRWVFSYIVGD